MATTSTPTIEFASADPLSDDALAALAVLLVDWAEMELTPDPSPQERQQPLTLAGAAVGNGDFTHHDTDIRGATEAPAKNKSRNGQALRRADSARRS